jgi:hypothetical protein
MTAFWLSGLKSFVALELSYTKTNWEALSVLGLRVYMILPLTASCLLMIRSMNIPIKVIIAVKRHPCMIPTYRARVECGRDAAPGAQRDMMQDWFRCHAVILNLRDDAASTPRITSISNRRSMLVSIVHLLVISRRASPAGFSILSGMYEGKIEPRSA